MQKMTHANTQPSAKGFTLLETMVALAVLAVGILGLAAMLGDSMAYMHSSQYDFIAQQKAEEAAEAIFTAKYNNPNNWAAISNNTVANPAGLFLVGPQPLLKPSPTGLVGSVDDVGVAPEVIVYPGTDGMLGTADDVQVPLSNFTRTIVIAAVAGNPNLRTIQITMNYSTGKFSNRTYVLNTYISAFN
jgi:prepilin-type N-terminal cleavage/methylation domain-containing protein